MVENSENTGKKQKNSCNEMRPTSTCWCWIVVKGLWGERTWVWNPTIPFAAVTGGRCIYHFEPKVSHGLKPRLFSRIQSWLNEILCVESHTGPGQSRVSTSQSSSQWEDCAREVRHRGIQSPWIIKRWESREGGLLFHVDMWYVQDPKEHSGWNPLPFPG